jgi:hypothetical protein
MKILITVILIFSVLKGFSQTESAETLRAQIKKLNSSALSLKAENNVIKDSLKIALDQNIYFRETLKIFEAKTQTVTADNLDFKLTSSKRKVGTTSVILEFLVINRDVNKSILFTPGRFADIIDLQGNGYNPSDINVGSNKYSSPLFKDVPLKLTITISGIDTSVKFLKLVSLQFSTPPTNYKKTEATFKDISIQ